MATVCPRCGGYKRVPRTRSCEPCEGLGVVTRIVDGWPIHSRCTACSGTGQQTIIVTCPRCGGKGTV